VKIKPFLSVGIVLVILLAGIFSGCSPKLNGNMPQFVIGDKWIYHWNSGGDDYTVTSVVTGDAMSEGKDCWVITTSFEPAYQDTVTGTLNTYDKTNLDIVTSDYIMVDSSKSTSYIYRVQGDVYYPLAIGKKARVTEYQTVTSVQSVVTQTENFTLTTETRVEKIERITTEAGTFDCFKVLKYDESGNLIQTSWRSDKTKLMIVKMTDAAAKDDYYELISYSVSKTK
jgi:hypothetical protein